MADRIFRLGLYEGLVVLPIQTRTSGVYRVNLGAPAGNSLLSTVYVKTVGLGSTVSVKYYDSGPGDGVDPGELIDLGGHSLLSSPAQSERVIITRISNKPFIEYTVVGSVEFGLHITVVADFPNEAPFLDGSVANLAKDKGQPITLYDPDAGVWKFAQSTGGALNVVNEAPGTPKLLSFSGVTTPGVSQSLISATPPLGKVWRLLQMSVTCRAESKIEALDNTDLIGSLRTGPASPNARFEWPPYTLVDIVNLEQFQTNGPPVDVEAFVFINEI